MTFRSASGIMMVALCATLAAPAPTRAAAPSSALPDTLSMLLDRWASSVGGRGPIASFRGMHLHARTATSGVPGTRETWVTRGGLRELVTEGTDRSEWVREGPTVWRRDWNGKTQELAGRDRADAVTDAFLRSLVYAGFTREALVGAGARDGGTDSTGAVRVVHLQPPDGLACDLSLDIATGQPLRAVRRAYDDEETIAFGDWRDAGGVRVPFMVVESSRGAGDTTVVTDATPLAAHDAMRFARPNDRASDVRFASGDRALGIPFNFENDHIMVDCRVNAGKPIWFMFDSGAAYNVINASRLAEFGCKPFGASTTRGGGGTTGSAFTHVDRLDVGGVALLGQRDRVLDLTGLERVYGMPLGGILGYDFASRFTIVVDYDALTMSLYGPGAAPDSVRGTPVPFMLEGNVPHARGEVVVDDGAPIPADFVIDSGAAESANLTSPFVREHRLLERARRTPAGQPNVTPGSEKEKQFFTQTSVRGKLRAIRLGAVGVTDIPVNLQQGTSGAYASASFSGTIGERLLRRFTSIYDYAHNTLTLQPNAEAAKPFAPRTTFGASLVSDGTDYRTFTVSAIRKDSPADSAGFRKDDVIAALDGKPAAEWRLAGLRAALAAAGSSHRAEVVRKGQSNATIDFTVRLVSIEDQ